ncbi:MAG: ammonia-forming cytochrome c nitrite reductase subunit c552 [bacterium]|nr:ammonia-forming cytochrome c nitrite reductase subunit c552 [bacterium]
MALISLLLVFSSGSLLGKPQDSCVECHKDPSFLVTNKKLYNYYQDWEGSPHQHAEVSCTACHMGNANTPGKAQAHKGLISRFDFKAIPKTCGMCHQEVFAAYQQSVHFKQMSNRQASSIGPNCITCHGIMNNVGVSVARVQETCSQCHNASSKGLKEIPRWVEQYLNKLASIHQFYRYVSVKGEPAETQQFLIKTDRKLTELNAQWHRLDQKEIQEGTDALMESLQSRRKSLSQ